GRGENPITVIIAAEHNDHVRRRCGFGMHQVATQSGQPEPVRQQEKQKESGQDKNPTESAANAAPRETTCPRRRSSGPDGPRISGAGTCVPLPPHLRGAAWDSAERPSAFSKERRR